MVKPEEFQSEVLNFIAFFTVKTRYEQIVVGKFTELKVGTS